MGCHFRLFNCQSSVIDMRQESITHPVKGSETAEELYNLPH